MHKRSTNDWHKFQRRRIYSISPIIIVENKNLRFLRNIEFFISRLRNNATLIFGYVDKRKNMYNTHIFFRIFGRGLHRKTPTFSLYS